MSYWFKIKTTEEIFLKIMNVFVLKNDYKQISAVANGV